MYRSPIAIAYKEMELQLEKCAKQLDEDIYKAVMQYAINVDEEELIRALNYDRNQYEKGYADGKAEAMAEVVRCKECQHYDHDGDYCGFWGGCRHPEHFCGEGVTDDGKE